MLRILRHTLAIVVPLLLLAVHLAVVLCFWNRWDETVAVTLIPIWAWALGGVVISGIVWPAFKSHLAAFTFALWTATGVALADETSGLLRQMGGAFSTQQADPKPLIPDPATKPAPDRLRVATLNLAGIPATQEWDSLAPLQPDLVFLQGVSPELDLAALAAQLCGTDASFVRSGTCALAGRGKLSILSEDLPPDTLIATLERPDGEVFDLMNVEFSHEKPAAPWWQAGSWVEFAERRRSNRRLLRTLLESLPKRIGAERQIVGGSFGAPPGDDVFRLFKNAGLTDSYRQAGQGWGNTYPAGATIMRSDQIWASAHFRALKSIVGEGSARHRAVVTEFQRVAVPEAPLEAPKDGAPPKP